MQRFFSKGIPCLIVARNLEIDDYIRPQMKVVAIEGEKEEVDQVYNELSEIIEKEK